MLDVIFAKENVGTQRALGTIFYAKGGFQSVDNYLSFVKAKDFGQISLQNAIEYSITVEEIYNSTLKNIGYLKSVNGMVEEITGNNVEQVEPSLKKSMYSP